MKRKLLSTALALCLLLSLLPVPLSQAAVEGNFRYEFLDGEITITGYEGTAPAALVIPSEIRGYPVTRIGQDAFRGQSSVTELRLPDTLISVGRNAFSFTDIQTLTLPNRVITLDKDAFSSCYKLTQVTIPASVTTIGESAFQDCRGLKSIEIPATVKEVGQGAFRGCDNLTTAIILNDTISAHEFDRCEKLTNVSIHNGVTSIGDGAFYRDKSIATLVLPASVRSIGYDTFNGCSGLTKLQLNDGLEKIGASAFRYCTSLKEVTIPGSVTVPGGTMFAECTSLTKVTLQEGVTSLGGAFEFCTNLREINIPSTMKNIYNNSFDHCDRLSNVSYSGTEAMWREISIGKIGNEPLTSAIITYGNQPVIVPRFTDVDPNQYYAEAVDWAVDNGVTAGTSPTTFSPDQPCTRGQVVTFIWRSLNKPSAVSVHTPYMDVLDTTAYYYEAVRWAAEADVTAGTDSMHFSPNATVTRGQVVTFLYRAAGSPKVTTTNSFRDVGQNDYFYDAVRWAVSKKITAGTGPTAFSPNDPCTRAQIVTFLYRWHTAQ